jgi:hypothetical protein
LLTLNIPQFMFRNLNIYLMEYFLFCNKLHC